MKDIESGIWFLIDSGSAVSILPMSLFKKPSGQSYQKLFAANDSEILVTGCQELKIDFNTSKKFVFNFLVGDVSVPIIGADFLKKHDLLPDLVRKRLVHGVTLCSTVGRVHMCNQPSINTISKKIVHDARVLELLKKYPALTQPPQYSDVLSHDVVHYITTKGPPVFDKPRRLQPSIFNVVKTEFSNMIASGMCRVSKSQWASPIVVIKKGGKNRVVGDYRKLNAQTVPDRYPLPRLHDAFSKLNNKSVFSYIDLVRAFHNVPIAPADVPKTALTSPVGLFEYLRMPLGLKNAPSTFQRFLNEVLFDLDFVFCYLDDILVFSPNDSEHHSNLKILFQRLHSFGLTINLDKSRFFCESVNFLGHRLSKEGWQPIDERVEFMRNMSKPLTITKLRRVLGTFNFYRIFAKNAAEHLAPLNELLKGHPRKNDRTPIKWTKTLEETFETVKKLFSDYTLLHFPVEEAKLVLTCDASGLACGAVLDQILGDGTRQPLGFFSTKFNDSQSHWQPYDKELFAIYSAVEFFEYMLEGRDVLLVTDHKPLLQMFVKKQRCKLERRSRQIEYISQFSTNIVHISGASNFIADMLSRPHINAITGTVSNSEIAAAQKTDVEILEIEKNGHRDHCIKKVSFEFDGITNSILCSFFRNVNRPLIPKSLRFSLFLQVHGLAHLSFKKTLHTLRSRFFWPNMTRDIRAWCKTCDACQKNKITRHSRSEIGVFPPSDRFEHVHLDLAVMKLVNGYRYMCTFVDRATRWMEAVPMIESTAEKVAQVFFDVWVSRFGVPLRVTTDRGPQFRSELFSEFCRLLGADHIQTTGYHPQANGLVERAHRTLKNALRCHENSWPSALPIVLYGLRTAPVADSNVTCAELVYGRTLKIPGEFCGTQPEIQNESGYVAQLRSAIRICRPQQYNCNPNGKKSFINKDLFVCKNVFVRVDRVKLPLQAPYDGPYRVVKRGKKVFTLEIDGKLDTVTIDRLKPAYQLDYNMPTHKLPGDLPKSILKDPTIGRPAPSSGKKVSFYRLLPNVNGTVVAHPHISTPYPSCIPTPNRRQNSNPHPVVTRAGRTVLPPVRYVP